MKQRGFTLLEILVALGILATGLAAAIRADVAATQHASTLRQRLLAQWVAENRLAELRARRLWPEPGESSGEAAMGQENFQWRQKVSATANVNFRRVEISVGQAGAATGNVQVQAYLWIP